MKQLIRLITLFLLLAVFVIPADAEPPQQSGEDFYRVARKLYDAGKMDEALAPCLKAIELNPNDYRPHAMAGFIYSLQKNYKSSSAALAEAIRLHPQDATLYFVKAQVDRFRSANVEAIAAARKAIEIDPNYAEAHTALGELLGVTKEGLAEGITALRTAIRLNPKLVEPYEALGNILNYYARDEKGAEEAFRQAIAVDPKHMSGRFALGRILIKQGRLVEARRLWDERTSDIDSTTLPPFIELLERAEKAKRDAGAQAKP